MARTISSTLNKRISYMTWTPFLVVHYMVRTVYFDCFASIDSAIRWAMRTKSVHKRKIQLDMDLAVQPIWLSAHVLRVKKIDCLSLRIERRRTELACHGKRNIKVITQFNYSQAQFATIKTLLESLFSSFNQFSSSVRVHVNRFFFVSSFKPLLNQTECKYG